MEVQTLSTKPKQIGNETRHQNPQTILSAMKEKPPEKWTPIATSKIGKNNAGKNFNASNPRTSKKNILNPIDW